MSITLHQLTKRYNGHPVVNNVTLEVATGEFFVLLGAGGSGKTTLLNMIAGLTGLDEGRILLHDRDVSLLATQERNVGFVFQNDALFQHMTVADNIEFGLRVRKAPASQRRRRCDELLEMVGLAGLGKRMPRQLSGGQQQRVALARALAHRPDVLLLDEPLGALDARVRVELRRTLRAVQRELGVTTLMVTHDQEEAFELADRMGVISFGRLLEVGRPDDLYRRPQTEFVATFLGTANLLIGRMAEQGVAVGPYHFDFDEKPAPLTLDDAQRIQVLFRPEDVVLACSARELAAPPLGCGEVEQVTFGGSFERLRLRLPPIPGVRPLAPPVAYGGSSLMVEATRTQTQAGALPLAPGARVWVGLNRVHVLAHPGLRFLILTDGSPQAMATVALAGRLARRAHARVTLLGYGQHHETDQRPLQETEEHPGSGLAALHIHTTSSPPGKAVRDFVEQEPCDLVILSTATANCVALAEQLLQAGEHHLLLLPPVQQLPQRALICIAKGEPGKEDVLFAGRLLRHVGAEATLLTVLSELDQVPQSLEQAQCFLDNGVRTLEMLGVPAHTAVHVGPVMEGILNRLDENNHDLLVAGAPLPDIDGNIILNGLISQLLRTITDRPILLVRSARQVAHPPAGRRGAKTLAQVQSLAQ